MMHHDVLFCFSVDRHRHLRLRQQFVVVKVCRFKAFVQDSPLLLRQLDVIIKLLEAVDLPVLWRVVQQQVIGVPELDMLDDGDVEEEDHTHGDDQDVDLVPVLGVTLDSQ